MPSICWSEMASSMFRTNEPVIEVRIIVLTDYIIPLTSAVSLALICLGTLIALTSFVWFKTHFVELKIAESMKATEIVSLPRTNGETSRGLLNVSPILSKSFLNSSAFQDSIIGSASELFVSSLLCFD